jgi:hypothetical protein
MPEIAPSERQPRPYGWQEAYLNPKVFTYISKRQRKDLTSFLKEML